MCAQICLYAQALRMEAEFVASRIYAKVRKLLEGRGWGDADALDGARVAYREILGERRRMPDENLD